MHPTAQMRFARLGLCALTSLGFAPIERYRADEMVDTEFYELRFE